MWQYSRSKLHEIGPRGVFAGWSLSFVKDSFGYAAFFATFEYVKAQAYYSFVAKYYGDLQGNLLSPILTPKLDGTGPINVIKPHYAIEPTFLMLAGITASITQQIVQHPLNLIQNIHYKSLAFLDSQAKIDQPRAAMLRSYYGAYKKTYDQCLVHAYVIFRFKFSLLNHILSPETCLGSMYTLDVFQGSPYPLQVGNTDS